MLVVIFLIAPLITADENMKAEVLRNTPSFRNADFMRTYYSVVISYVIITGLVYLLGLGFIMIIPFGLIAAGRFVRGRRRGNTA